jgi:8-oxo-dGTP diphosphatase
MKREWVVGFLFDAEAEFVILIRKNRPEWQKGKLNGVGGKVEPNELIEGAMYREFREETGVIVPPQDWHRFCSLRWEEGLVHFFRAFRPAPVLDKCRTTTDESIERHKVHTLGAPGRGRANITPNLLWLVPLAAHRHDTYDVIDVIETGTTLRKPGRLDVFAGSSRTEP